MAAIRVIESSISVIRSPFDLCRCHFCRSASVRTGIEPIPRVIGIKSIRDKPQPNMIDSDDPDLIIEFLTQIQTQTLLEFCFIAPSARKEIPVAFVKESNFAHWVLRSFRHVRPLKHA